MLKIVKPIIFLQCSKHNKIIICEPLNEKVIATNPQCLNNIKINYDYDVLSFSSVGSSVELHETNLYIVFRFFVVVVDKI